jgi:hypothetical protein
MRCFRGIDCRNHTCGRHRQCSYPGPPSSLSGQGRDTCWYCPSAVGAHRMTRNHVFHCRLGTSRGMAMNRGRKGTASEPRWEAAFSAFWKSLEIGMDGIREGLGGRLIFSSFVCSLVERNSYSGHRAPECGGFHMLRPPGEVSLIFSTCATSKDGESIILHTYLRTGGLGVNLVWIFPFA